MTGTRDEVTPGEAPTVTSRGDRHPGTKNKTKRHNRRVPVSGANIFVFCGSRTRNFQMSAQSQNRSTCLMTITTTGPKVVQYSGVCPYIRLSVELHMHRLRSVDDHFCLRIFPDFFLLRFPRSNELASSSSNVHAPRVVTGQRGCGIPRAAARWSSGRCQTALIDGVRLLAPIVQLWRPAGRQL